MSWTDPSIELVSCGETGWSDWDRVVLEGLAEFVRYHSVHIYTGSDDYWTNVLVPHQAERAIRITGALIEQIRYNQKIKHPIQHRLRRVERLVPRAGRHRRAWRSGTRWPTRSR